ncbi:MAG TPA: MFS transporter [Methylibium sp.]|uniref:MFS transporter n=1 Tax=Methylibium sp. TaxID=2067992 RepID=UPI002DBBC940|nr:MFS transporter [Methylibium sp.]HEU4460060.1 MFS transporter [Methylibium sp.]
MNTTDARTAGVPPRAAGYPSLGTAGVVIGVLFAVTLMAQLDRQLPALLVRPLRAEFGLSDTAFSLLQGYAFALSFTLAGLPLGRWVDRSSRKLLILAGLLFWSAATALFAFGRSYEELLLARVGVGIGEAVLAPAAYSLIADLVPSYQRGRALAIYGVSLAIGSGASLLLGGWLLAAIPAEGLHVAGFGDLAAWRVAFLAAAAPGLPLALLLMLAVREPARQHDTAVVAPADASSLADFFAHLRRHPGCFARLLAFPSVLSYLGYAALGWAPALFERSHGIAPSRSGVVLGVLVALAGAAGMLCGGAWSDRWLAGARPAARLRVALLGMAVASAPALLWPVLPSAALGFGLIAVMVFGISLAQSAVPTSIQAVFPNRLRGQAFACYLLMSGLLGIGLGPTAVALLADRVLPREAGLGMAIAMAAAPAVLLGLWMLASGLRPYARCDAELNPTAPARPGSAG